MANAKVVALKTRSSQISHLCFPVNGIIESLAQVKVRRVILGKPKNPGGGSAVTYRPIQLGDKVTQFDFTSFYASLNNTPSSDHSRLSYGSSGILNDASVTNCLLMTQRAESTAAVLDKAVNARQNAYFAKYANQRDIISVMQKFYSATKSRPSTTISKPDGLAELGSCAQSQMNDLLKAYKQHLLPTVPHLSEVVKETSSVLKTTGDFPDTTQTITNTDYAYRAPSYEAQAHGLRAQISLMDQQFSQYMAGQNMGKLKEVFDNELQSIDLDVKRLQIAYLNTILLSPITGLITGIYKNPGDWVRAGEPVIRVEDNSSIILVGTLAYQGLISIGSELTITTRLFDASSSPSIVGKVIAVRGHPNEDDLWEVHAICDTSAGVPSAVGKLPPNYNFDYDNTSVVIS
jgi:HlyD family secretion protein